MCNVLTKKGTVCKTRGVKPDGKCWRHCSPEFKTPSKKTLSSRVVELEKKVKQLKKQLKLLAQSVISGQSVNIEDIICADSVQYDEVKQDVRQNSQESGEESEEERQNAQDSDKDKQETSEEDEQNAQDSDKDKQETSEEDEQNAQDSDEDKQNAQDISKEDEQDVSEDEDKQETPEDQIEAVINKRREQIKSFIKEKVIEEVDLSAQEEVKLSDEERTQLVSLGSKLRQMEEFFPEEDFSPPKKGRRNNGGSKVMAPPPFEARKVTRSVYDDMQFYLKSWKLQKEAYVEFYEKKATQLLTLIRENKVTDRVKRVFFVDTLKIYSDQILLDYNYPRYPHERSKKEVQACKEFGRKSILETAGEWEKITNKYLAML